MSPMQHSLGQNKLHLHLTEDMQSHFEKVNMQGNVSPIINLTYVPLTIVFDLALRRKQIVPFFYVSWNLQ